MSKGRKAIPSKIHQLRGLPGKRPLNDLEPKPPEGMPECPQHLDDLAREEWARAGAILDDIGLMTGLDMAVLAGYCQSYSEWARATTEVQKLGLVYKRADGTPGLNPYLRVSRESYDRMLKAAVLLGLSPSSRAGLKVNKKDPESKVNQFMAKKHG